MASPYALARSRYRRIVGDDAAVAQARADLEALERDMQSGGGTSMQITSSTVNGQSFTATHGLTVSQRYDFLRLLVAMIDQGGGSPSKVQPYF
jgi:hypothetical protein